MLKDDVPELYRSFEVARAAHQKGDLVGAEAIYSRLLALDPADDEVLLLFGSLKTSKGETDVGLECMRMAQALNPRNAQIPFNMGVVLQEAGRIPEAIQAYRTAVAVQPTFREAWENLCAACYDVNDFESGLVAAERALELDQESLLAIRGAANCLTALGRRAEALSILEDGLKSHPALPELRIHRSWELMANGRFAEAWRELEWRNSRKGKADPAPRSVPYPRWNGEPLSGKTLLVYGEQGIGDEVMYAPFVSCLIQAGARCVLECERRLEGLFARAFPDCTILRREERGQIPWYASLPDIDYCLPALSLPLYFERPQGSRSFLFADGERTRCWRGRLAQLGGGAKIGVSWRGGADAKARMFRSIPERIFSGLIGGAATFVSLQYGATETEVTEVSPDLVFFPEVDPLTDLEEFLALLSALDAVVSVDNSTVHFAGALGVSTLLLLPVYSEWRWGNKVSGMSCWYQSVEQIRQREASDQGWVNVLKEARKWLEKFDSPTATTLDTSAPPQTTKVAEVLATPAVEKGRRAVLLGDTNYWYHWGCSCTSLGLHEGLRSQFDSIKTVTMLRLWSGGTISFGPETLDSDESFSLLDQIYPDVLAAMRDADYVVINGEGTIHGASAMALLLLYLGYVAKNRLGKPVALVNHSCFPGELPAVREYYAKVYRSIDLAVARESLSLNNVSALGGKTALGFDCLPLFLQKHRPELASEQKRKLVLGGSVSWSREMVSCFSTLAEWASTEGLAIEILSGAKALLAADEIGFVESMVRALDAKGVAHQLHFPISEREWLSAIGGASLVVSGRFHYSVAAAFQRVPFMVAESNTNKISGLLADLGLEPTVAGLANSEYGDVIGKAGRLVGTDGPGLVSATRLDELRLRASANFQIA